MPGFEPGQPILKNDVHVEIFILSSDNATMPSYEEGCARMRTSTSVLVILMSLVIAMPRVQAQASHTASQSAIDAALQAHVSSADADRADLLRVLANSEVKAVADKAGLDLRRATTAVTSLQGQELTQLAAQARQVDEALAGGQSKVVISTTMIIIVLLVLILLIVAID